MPKKTSIKSETTLALKQHSSKGIPWAEIYEAYISNEATTFEQLSKSYHISMKALSLHSTQGNWVQKKLDLQNKAMAEAETRALEIIKERNEIHIDRATKILDAATKQLEAGIVPRNARDLIAWFDTAIKIERNARQMDAKTHSLSFDRKNQSITLQWGDGKIVTPQQ